MKRNQSLELFQLRLLIYSCARIKKKPQFPSEVASLISSFSQFTRQMLTRKMKMETVTMKKMRNLRKSNSVLKNLFNRERNSARTKSSL